jgi:hypothetical protein
MCTDPAQEPNHPVRPHQDHIRCTQQIGSNRTAGSKNHGHFCCHIACDPMTQYISFIPISFLNPEFMEEGSHHTSCGVRVTSRWGQRHRSRRAGHAGGGSRGCWPHVRWDLRAFFFVEHDGEPGIDVALRH